MSEGETNSETIDDFSQYSTKTNDNNSPELNANSGQNTLVSKSVHVKINKNDDTFRESQYDELLNDGTDNMDDVMIQISKRTTVKKIITKTTSVNGVTQSNETESFFKDSQVNDTVADSGLKSDRSPKSTNLSNHMEDSHDDMLDKESPNSLSDVDQIRIRESSPTKKMETLHRRDNERDPITPKGDHIHQNRETNEMARKHIAIPIPIEKEISPNSEVKEKKIKERKRDETFDIPDHRPEKKNKFDQKLSPNSEINSKNPPGSYLRSNKELNSHKSRTKVKRESGKYIHEPEKVMSSSKNNVTYNGYIDDSEKDNSTLPNHIKWVDPLKTYHLKYDLHNNNNRALLNQIKEKRVALQNSDPNLQMKDRIDKKNSRTESKPSSKSLRKIHNETKQFIIRGNLKENSFQNRHSFNRHKTQDNSFQNNKKQDGLKLTRINYIQKRSHRSLTNLNDILNDKSITRSDSRNGDLTPQVSQILDEFELNKHKKSVTHANFGVSRYCLARCGHQDSCFLNYCANFHIHCTPCCWQSCHIRCPINNLSEDRRCLSYQNLSSGRISSDVESEEQFNMHNPERTSNFENSNISNKGFNGFSSNKKHIAYLERKLSSIENKIRNMHVNESTITYQRENDLEKQCKDIERQLVALYKTSINFREAF